MMLERETCLYVMEEVLRLVELPQPEPVKKQTCIMFQYVPAENGERAQTQGEKKKEQKNEESVVST